VEMDSEGDQQGMDTEIPESRPRDSRGTAKPARKLKRISKHGIEYPALPPTFVKKVAQTALQTSGLSNHRISPETLTALTQASEWFFEQLGDDLGAYASHAKRKTIEESDVVTLMRRYVSGYRRGFQFSSNMVQTTSNRIQRHHVLVGAEAPPERTPAGVENARAATREETPGQEGARR
jgi:histone H3/H4